MVTSVSKTSRVAMAVGRTFGFIGRMFNPIPTLFKWRWNRPSKLSGKKPHNHQEQLEIEIDRIEMQLDFVYRQIVDGAGMVRKEPAGSRSSELEGLLSQSKQLKEMLRLKRLELSRLKRDELRNHRLKGTPSPKSEPKISPITVKKREQESPPTEKPLINRKLSKAIQQAVRKSSFSDNSKRILFDNTIRDLLEGEAETRRAAATHLGEIKNPAAAQVLHILLDDSDNRVCAASLNSLSVLGQPLHSSTFRRFVDREEDYLRLAALRGLARIGNPQDTPIFIDHLEDRNPAIRKASATYLGWRREKEAIRRLVRALYDGDESVRTAAATSLGNIKSDKAVMALIRTLGDENESVAKAAKAALETILNKKIEFELITSKEFKEVQIEELKEWWGKTRIEEQLNLEGIPAAPAMTSMESQMSVTQSAVDSPKVDHPFSAAAKPVPQSVRSAHPKMKDELRKAKRAARDTHLESQETAILEEIPEAPSSDRDSEPRLPKEAAVDALQPLLDAIENPVSEGASEKTQKVQSKEEPAGTKPLSAARASQVDRSNKIESPSSSSSFLDSDRGSPDRQKESTVVATADSSPLNELDELEDIGAAVANHREADRNTSESVESRKSSSIDKGVLTSEAAPLEAEDSPISNNVEEEKSVQTVDMDNLGIHSDGLTSEAAPLEAEDSPTSNNAEGEKSVQTVDLDNLGILSEEEQPQLGKANSEENFQDDATSDSEENGDFEFLLDS